MNLEQAWALIQQVCAAHVGPLADHQNIQQAISIVGVKLSEQAIPPYEFNGQDTKVDATETE